MRKRIVLYVLLAIVAIISGILFVHYNKVQNVFDEIYYTWDKENLFVRTKFKNVKAFENERIEGYIYAGDNKRTNELVLVYDDSYMKKETSTLLCIYGEDKFWELICFIEYEEGAKEKVAGEELIMIFTYDVETKILLLEPFSATSDIFVEEYPDKYKYYKDYNDPQYIEMFMAEHNITKEEIEAYRDYFLRDVLIGMWVDGNDEESRYDRSDAGHFVLEDELFANFE